MTKRNWRRAVASILAGAIPLPAAAQNPTQPSAAVFPYRAPVIALAKPPNGGTVAEDDPVVVFHFIAGEAADLIDPKSFSVSIDGVDRTPSFEVTAEAARGSLATSAEPAVLGGHDIVAKICSTHGACSTTTARVTVTPGDKSASKWMKRIPVIAALFIAIKALLKS